MNKCRRALAADGDKALIAVTMDLEMSRHYPTRGATRWDYEKGNLDEPSKQYAVETCRRVKAAGGPVHSFLLGRTLEQENVDWLKGILKDGHVLGNHTYDHVRLNARTPETIQFRFRLAPWLIDGKSPREVIVDNIRMTELAMKQRLDIKPVGLRTPYGFSNGLTSRPDVQQMLLELGYSWVSSKYHQPQDLKASNPSAANFAAVTRCMKTSQPLVYPSGLVEIPIAPVSDVNAFRTRKWKLDEYLKTVEKNFQWAVKNRAVYDYGFHPSVMYVEDPELRAVDLICRLVERAGDKAAIVDLETIALRARLRDGTPA